MNSYRINEPELPQSAPVYQCRPRAGLRRSVSLTSPVLAGLYPECYGAAAVFRSTSVCRLFAFHAIRPVSSRGAWCSLRHLRLTFEGHYPQGSPPWDSHAHDHGNNDACCIPLSISQCQAGSEPGEPAGSGGPDLRFMPFNYRLDRLLVSRCSKHHLIFKYSSPRILVKKITRQGWRIVPGMDRNSPGLANCAGYGS
jgi:hypothetical protein